MSNQVSYYLSAGHDGDGKSVCLWRKQGVASAKVARFQSTKVAKQFATEFDFPLSESLQEFIQSGENK